MSEERVVFRALNTDMQHDIITTDLYTVRDKLADLECQLISLLVTVQRAQGKEPSVMTRAERRRR